MTELRHRQWNQAQLDAMRYWRSLHIGDGKSKRATVSEDKKALGAAIRARDEIAESRRIQEEMAEVWD